ncbi:RICIN domain-containing protein [Nonomuraea recticatena]|uniref:Ricin B lectin domain-containing protein n=1 Tax=Nonomuraea recticatena TaxID=46178 RepID=A0ABP6FNZ0_9ACTN
MTPASLLRRLTCLIAAAGLSLGLASSARATTMLQADPHPAVWGWVDENRTYKIDNVLTGGHLVPEGWGFNSNEGLPIYSAVSDAGNGWKFQQRRHSDGWAYYQIKNIHTNRCIKPGPLGGLNRTLVIQVACNTSDSSQYWRVERSSFSRNEVQFVNHSSGEAFRPWTDVNVDQWVFLTNPGVRATYWALDAV